MCQCLVHCAPLVLLLTQKIRRLQPCPSKAVMWTPAFCLIYILRHSPSIPPLPAAPCQHHHPTTPTGFIKNAEFKLISDIWPFVKLFTLRALLLSSERPRSSQKAGILFISMKNLNFIHLWQKSYFYESRELMHVIWMNIHIWNHYRIRCEDGHNKLIENYELWNYINSTLSKYMLRYNTKRIHELAHCIVWFFLR